MPPAGLLSKTALLQYIQSGGSASTGPDNSSAAAKRRNETLYRVYSIEQYTLASALAELSAAALTPGMRTSGASLRELAAVHHQQQEAAAANAAGSGSGGPAGEGEEALAGTAVSNSSSVQQLDLLTEEAEAADAQSQAHAGSAVERHRPSFLPPQEQPGKEEPGRQQALLVEVAQPLPQTGGLLAWLGLSSGTPLRATPGTAAQFGLLLLRSGESPEGAQRYKRGCRLAASRHASLGTCRSCPVMQLRGATWLGHRQSLAAWKPGCALPPCPCRHQVDTQLVGQDAGDPAAGAGGRGAW